MININSKKIEVPEPLQDVPLVDFLRDFMGLKGTKFGCGSGLCGACSVHIDGAAVRSCQLLVSDVEGQTVTTIEGLADTVSTEGLHPVQKAWVEDGVPQCGYCQTGQIMTASALLNRNSNPSIEEIRTEMDGNLCRCGTYSKIQKAILNIAKGN